MPVSNESLSDVSGMPAPGRPLRFRSGSATITISHPLDRITEHNPNPNDHLDAAIGWTLDNTHRRLDALAAALSQPVESAYKLPTILEHNDIMKRLRVPKPHFDFPAWTELAPRG